MSCDAVDLRLRKLPAFLDAIHDALFKLPASHLPDAQNSADLVGTDLRIVANQIAYSESILERDLAVMEYSVRCNRLLMLALAALPRMWRSPLVEGSSSALTTYETLPPLLIGQKFQTALLITEQGIKREG